MTLRTRKPSGAVPWPCLLIEGGEGAGKSFLAAQLTASQRVGKSYWLEIGSEGTADEYGAIPGVRYELIVHDGTWTDITGQIAEVKTEAQNAADAGEPPTVLVIDTMTAEWEMLGDWADNRARARENRKRARSNQALVADDSAVTVGMDLWNDAKSRHRRLMSHLLMFPGIVVLLARAGEVAKVENGRPVENQRDYKVRGEKDLAFDATAWVRLDRSAPPRIVKLRSVHSGVRPGRDKPKEVKDLSLDWLVFDYMKCDPRTARVRDLVHLKPGSDDPHTEEIAGLRARVLGAGNEDDLRTIWDEIKTADLGSAATNDGDDLSPTTLAKLATDKLANVRERSRLMASQSQMRRIFALLKKRGIGEDGRLAAASMALGRDIASFKHLSADDASRLIVRLEQADEEAPRSDEPPADEQQPTSTEGDQ